MKFRYFGEKLTEYQVQNQTRQCGQERSSAIYGIYEYICLVWYGIDRRSYQAWYGSTTYRYNINISGTYLHPGIQGVLFGMKPYKMLVLPICMAKQVKFVEFRPNEAFSSICVFFYISMSNF